MTCSLCRTFIVDRCYAHGERAWLGRCQLVQLGRGEWHLPRNCSVYERRGMMTTHRACWSIVKSIFGPDRDFEDTAWMGRFANTLLDLEPWLRQVKGPDVPQLCDSYNFDEKIPVNEDTSGCFDRFGLPTEIVQVIYDYLSDWKDVVNLMEVSAFTPSAKQLLSLGRRYLAPSDSPIQGTTDVETVNRTRWLLWNLQFRPQSLPRTLNYKTVWENAELLDEKLRQPLRGSPPDPSAHPSRRHTVEAAEPPGSMIEKTIGIGSVLEVSKISFYFTSVGDEMYLCGLGVDGRSVGYESDMSINVSVGQFRGLLLASDGIGFTSAKVRDKDSWKQDWLRPLSRIYNIPEEDWRESELRHIPPLFSQFEWPPGICLSLHVFLDSFKIQTLAHTPHASEPESWPITWPFRCPPQTLTPLPLVDISVPGDGLFFHYTDDFKGVTGITAFADEYGQLRRFDFTSNRDVLRTIGGLCRAGWRRVDFELDSDRGEAIDGVACAVGDEHLCPRLSFEFLTSCGRAIRFGARAPSSKWNAAWCQNGIFASCRISLNSDRYSPSSLSVFGVLRDNSQPEIAPPDVASFEDVCAYDIEADELHDN